MLYQNKSFKTLKISIDSSYHNYLLKSPYKQIEKTFEVKIRIA